MLLAAALTVTACGNSEDGSSQQTTAAPGTSDTAAVTKTAPETESNNDSQEEQGMKKYESMICELPPEGYDGAKEGVTYPGFKKYTYYSSTAERDTNVNVLLPEDYSEDKQYPVLYLLHGFYGNEDSLADNANAVSRILTNLQQSGEAEEMIVVLPYIYCSKDMPYVTAMDLENCLNYDNFINDLVTDLMPYIEENFSVAKGRENTAITGFSMGGREALFIGFTRPDLFGYIGGVCPAPGLIEIPNSPMHPGQLDKSQLRFDEKNKPRVLLISSSKSDGVVTDAPDSYRAVLTENGEEFLSHVMEYTGHDHTSVKPHLYNYFRLLFRS